MNKIKIAPSILSADFSKMGEAIKNIENWGADLIHCDVMDGVFVKNITFGFKMIKDIRKLTTLPLDCHLMIVNPENYIERFAESGADIITIHQEATKDLKGALSSIKKLNIKCGAVISPDTAVSEIKDVIEFCDMILIMSVYPGFGGQKFIENSLKKIEEMKKLILLTGKDIDLQVDGGITLENVSRVKNAGANVIVAGNTVFSAVNPRKAIEELRG